MGVQADLNQKLYQAKERLRLKQKYEEHLDRLYGQMREKEIMRNKLQNQLAKEQKDVEDLEKFTWKNVFYSLTGRKMEKLDKEMEEAIAAQVQFNEAVHAIENMKKEIREYEEKLASVADAEKEYQETIRQKERYILETDSPLSEELFSLTEREAELSSQIKEYGEAIAAGNAANDKLQVAIQSLESAKGWSTFDMFGGDLVGTIMKHCKLEEAERHIHDAQNQLRRFQEELMDIHGLSSVNLEIGKLLTFADYFLDNIFVDWLVHGKINDAYDQTMDTSGKVKNLLNHLTEAKKKLEAEWESVKRKRTEILER